MPSLVRIFVTLCGIVAASDIRSTYVVKDKHYVPQRWTRVGPAPANHKINLQIGLTQNKFDELERHLYEVSDPSHHRYGKHLSQAEVSALIEPKPETLDLVHDWLSAHGVEKSDLAYSLANDWINVVLPVEDVERLLDTKYSTFEHEDGSTIVRTTEFSLPKHLHEHITTVQPSNSFFRAAPQNDLLKAKPQSSPNHPAPKLEKRESQVIKIPERISTTTPLPENSSIAAVCNFTAVTPLCLRTLYGTLNYTVQVPGENKVGLCDYLGELNNRSDIYEFLELYRPEAAAAAYEFDQISIAGGTVQQTEVNETQYEDGTGIEGNLDAETILGIAWPTPLVAYSTGGLDPTFVPDLWTTDNTDEPYITWVNYILSQDKIPQTISTSYSDDEQTISKSYAVAVCNQFAQLGARGVTVMFASGDFGVGPPGYCYSNADNTTFEFLPDFPNTCPYVTSVGATQDYPEVVAYDYLPSLGFGFASGAGFSNYFPQPSYQAAAVDAYVTSLDGEYDGFYNKSGRAYPDIAANGKRYVIVWDEEIFTVDGTSASTPAAAAIISLVNDALIAAGRPPLGFINPWLYSWGHKAFTDVTSGSSVGCDTAGFPAEVGWDAATGFGTPYLPALLEILGLSSSSGSR